MYLGGRGWGRSFGIGLGGRSEGGGMDDTPFFFFRFACWGLDAAFEAMCFGSVVWDGDVCMHACCVRYVFLGRYEKEYLVEHYRQLCVMNSTL